MALLDLGQPVVRIGDLGVELEDLRCLQALRSCLDLLRFQLPERKSLLRCDARIDELLDLPGELLSVEQPLLDVLGELDLHLVELTLEHLELLWLDPLAQRLAKLAHNFINLILLAAL